MKYVCISGRTYIERLEVLLVWICVEPEIVQISYAHFFEIEIFIGVHHNENGINIQILTRLLQFRKSHLCRDDHPRAEIVQLQLVILYNIQPQQ